jgi:hypothetical protein
MNATANQGQRTPWKWRGSATVSDRRCDYKGSKDNARSGGGEGVQRVCNGVRSCNCKGSKENALSGGGEVIQWCQIMNASNDNARPGGEDGVRWRQITHATAKESGITHSLVERECDGVRS